MSQWIERLDERQMMSTTTPVNSITLNPKNATLVVRGSAGDDAANIRVISGNRIRATVVSKTGDGEPFATTVTVPIGSVNFVNFYADTGTDSVELDAYTQGITSRPGVEFTRIIATKTLPSGKVKTVEITDPFSTPLLGLSGGSNAGWIKRSTAQIADDAALAPTSHSLFLGDSMFDRFRTYGSEYFDQYFGKYAPSNLALPGDTTSQLLYRIQHQGLLDSYPRVRAVVLNIGTNNITLSDDIDAIARGIEKVVAEIKDRLPAADIVLTSILPRSSRSTNRVIRDVNNALFVYSKTAAKVTFVDATPPYIAALAYGRKWYRPNEVHLTPFGYRNWAYTIYQDSRAVWTKVLDLYGPNR